MTLRRSDDPAGEWRRMTKEQVLTGLAHELKGLNPAQFSFVERVIVGLTNKLDEVTSAHDRLAAEVEGARAVLLLIKNGSLEPWAQELASETLARLGATESGGGKP